MSHSFLQSSRSFWSGISSHFLNGKGSNGGGGEDGTGADGGGGGGGAGGGEGGFTTEDCGTLGQLIGHLGKQVHLRIERIS